jgi:hypothetical protein
MAQTDNLPEWIVINDHKQGDTFVGGVYTITKNGVAKDLTGAQITMTFLHKNRRSDNDHVLQVGTGLTITNAASGIFEMDEIPGADMDWISGDYYYDVQIIYADGEVKTPVEGTWKIVQDKTNNNS